MKSVRTTFVEDKSYWTTTLGRGPISPRAYPDYRVDKKTTHKSALPKDQKALVEMVKALAVKYGFELKVVDVTEKGLLQGLGDKLHGINTFPAFVTDGGFKVEGDITEERIKTLFVSRRQGRV